MDSFEINKILGALLGTCLVLVAMHLAAEAIFTPPVAAKPGYEIAVKEQQPTAPQGTAAAPAAAAAAAPAEVPFDTLLASASGAQGGKIAKQCEACHNLGKGAGAKIGPDLYGVVGRPVASVPGFNYSDALKAKGGTWTFDALNTWLANPRGDVPGTAMLFAGISNAKQRADVIAFLNSNADNPLPLPKTPKAAGGQPASANPPEAPGAAPPQ